MATNPAREGRRKKKTIKWSELDNPNKEIKCQTKLDELLSVVKEGEKTLDSESLSEAFLRAGKATCKQSEASRPTRMV